MLMLHPSQMGGQCIWHLQVVLRFPRLEVLCLLAGQEHQEFLDLPKKERKEGGKVCS